MAEHRGGDAALNALPSPGHALSQRGSRLGEHGDEEEGWSGDVRGQPGGTTAQGLSPQEKQMMEARREGLAWGWLRARCRLGQARVPLATSSLGVIYGRSGILRSPSPGGSVLRRWVESCR